MTSKKPNAQRKQPAARTVTREVKPRKSYTTTRKTRYPGSMWIQGSNDMAARLDTLKPNHERPERLRKWQCALIVQAAYEKDHGGGVVQKKALSESFIKRALRRDLPYFRPGNRSNPKPPRRVAMEEVCKQLAVMLDKGVFVPVDAPAVEAA